MNSISKLPNHLGGHANVTHIDIGLLLYAKNKLGVTTRLDVGSGTGGMVEAARARGIEAYGIDGDFTLKRTDDWFILEREKVAGHGWTKYYRLPYFGHYEEDVANAYYEGLFNKIAAILNEKTPDELYGLLAGLVLINNKMNKKAAL